MYMTIIGWQNGILSHPIGSGESLPQDVNILRRRFFLCFITKKSGQQ